MVVGLVVVVAAAVTKIIVMDKSFVRTKYQTSSNIA